MESTVDGDDHLRLARSGLYWLFYRYCHCGFSFGSSEPSRVHAWLVVDDLRRARSTSAALGSLAGPATWKSQISAIGSPSVISTTG
jgi:hypothetical protein